MTFFLVETYIVKPDKLREFLAYHNKWIEWWKKNPEVCKEIKSNKLFAIGLEATLAALSK